MHESIYPTLFRAAMDYLPIQASAVPCERVFSSAGETDTKRRNRMKPELMEALQMLKFLLKKKRLNFMEGWKVTEEALIGDDEHESGLNAFLDATSDLAMRDYILESIVGDDE